jgi:hypothetical protein
MADWDTEPVLSGKFYRRIKSTKHVKGMNDTVMFNSRPEPFISIEKTTGMTSVIIEFDEKSSNMVNMQRCYFENTSDLAKIFEQYLLFYQETFSKPFFSEINIAPYVIYYKNVRFNKALERKEAKICLENYLLKDGYRFSINTQLGWSISKPEKPKTLALKVNRSSNITCDDDDENENNKENYNPSKKVKLDTSLLPSKSSSSLLPSKSSSSLLSSKSSSSLLSSKSSSLLSSKSSSSLLPSKSSSVSSLNRQKSAIDNDTESHDKGSDNDDDRSDNNNDDNDDRSDNNNDDNDDRSDNDDDNDDQDEDVQVQLVDEFLVCMKLYNTI